MNLRHLRQGDRASEFLELCILESVGTRVIRFCFEGIILLHLRLHSSVEWNAIINRNYYDYFMSRMRAILSAVALNQKSIVFGIARVLRRSA